MSRTILYLSIALALPVVGAIVWILVPTSRPEVDSPLASRPVPVTAAAVTELTISNERENGREAVTGFTADVSKIVRHSDEDFPEIRPNPQTSQVAPPLVQISPRYTAATQAVPGFQNVVQAPGTRIRVLPEGVAPGATSGVAFTGSADSSGKAAPGKAVVLELESALHDPAAWTEEEKPLGEKQAEVKTEIGDAFAREVASVATKPGATDTNLEDAWRASRAKANREYEKFFGADAANKAAINAGRAALAK